MGELVARVPPNYTRNVKRNKKFFKQQQCFSRSARNWPNKLSISLHFHKLEFH